MIEKNVLIWATVVTLLALTTSANAWEHRESPTSSSVTVYTHHSQTFRAHFGGLTWPETWDYARWYVDGNYVGSSSMSGQSDIVGFSYGSTSPGIHTVRVHAHWDWLFGSSWSGWVSWTVNVLDCTPSATAVSPGSPVKLYEGDTQACTVDADYDVTANFEADAPVEQRTLTISSTAGGCVSAPGEGEFTYDPGSVVALQATADAMCQFVCWSGPAVDAGQVADPSAAATTVTLDEDGVVCATFASTLAAIYVDDDAPEDPGPGDASVSDPNENGTPEHPFDEIQEGICVAGAGASVIVRSGTYFENIDLLGKDILLTGFDPDNADVSSYPVIDGAGAGPVVSFTNGEGPDCSVVGFAITRGQGEPAGGIYCAGSSPTVINCLVVGNRSISPNGGAVYCVDSNAVFFNCTIADNYGGESGAGLYTADSNVALVNSILWANLPSEIVVAGGAEPNVAYCDVAGGSAGDGNMDADPLFAAAGFWADAENPDVAVAAGEADAIWIDGDYHLLSERGRYVPAYSLWTFDDATSPCIDAGDPAMGPSAERAPNGGRINMGTYGGTQQASLSPNE